MEEKEIINLESTEVKVENGATPLVGEREGSNASQDYPNLPTRVKTGLARAESLTKKEGDKGGLQEGECYNEGTTQNYYTPLSLSSIRRREIRRREEVWNIVPPPRSGEVAKGGLDELLGDVFHCNEKEEKFENTVGGWVVFKPGVLIVDITDSSSEDLARLFPKTPDRRGKKEAGNKFKKIVREGTRISSETVRIGELLGAGWVRWKDKDCLVVKVSVNGEDRIAIVRSTGVFNAPYRSEPGRELPRTVVWVSEDKGRAEALAEQIMKRGSFPPYRAELVRLSNPSGAISVVPANKRVEEEIRNLVSQGKWLDHATLRGHKLSLEMLTKIISHIEKGEVVCFLVDEGDSQLIEGWKKYSLYMEVFFQEGERILRAVVVFHFDTLESITNFEELREFEILPLSWYFLMAKGDEGLPHLIELFLGSIRSGNMVKILDEERKFVPWTDYRTLGRFFTQASR